MLLVYHKYRYNVVTQLAFFKDFSTKKSPFAFIHAKGEICIFL